jgi:predicted nucleotidyltransferase
MLTQNEKKVLKLIFSGLKDELSINQIAKACALSPNGAMKILKKFEREGIMNYKTVANTKIYYLDFMNEKTKNILKLALIQDSLDKKIKYRLEDLKPLKSHTKACILFGSYIKPGNRPNDLDILFILNKNQFPELKKISKQVYDTLPLKVHDALQTEEDFENNLIKKDKVLLSALRNGIILWGHDSIIELVEHATK